jgi:2-iminobutanoate/2-iminopropanoate deaminase
MNWERIVIATDRAPAAVGPYSQAVRIGNLVYTAGQIPLDPATGKLVEGGIESQTRRALQNLQAVLEAAGTSLANVVKTTVFLQDMGDFGAMNGVYAQFFGGSPPARSAVEVAALPLSAQVEIEAIALVE